MATFTNVLTASVVYIDATSGKVRQATQITIRLGTLVVATKTIGNRWSQVQALAEFRRDPVTGWTQGPAYTGAKQLRLVA